MYDKVPHFSTFGKNYTRRFQDTDLFEQIFSQILSKCYKYKLVDPNEIFIDSTHVKARANNKKWRKKIAEQETLFYRKGKIGRGNPLFLAFHSLFPSEFCFT